MTRLLSTLLLTVACAAAALAQQPLSKSSLTAPSPAAMSAPVSSTAAAAAQDDDLLRACEICAARRRAAEAKVTSLESIIVDKDRQLAAKEQIIAAKDEVIATLKTIDRNSQQIDTNSQRIDQNSQFAMGLLRQQIVDDARRITDLTDDLTSCQSNQKWVAGISLAVGGGLAWWARGKTQQLVPQFFSPFGGATALQQMMMQPAPAGQYLQPGSPLSIEAAVRQTLEQSRRK